MEEISPAVSPNPHQPVATPTNCCSSREEDPANTTSDGSDANATSVKRRKTVEEERSKRPNHTDNSVNYVIVRLNPTDNVLKLFQLLITNGFSQCSFIQGKNPLADCLAQNHLSSGGGDDPLHALSTMMMKAAGRTEKVGGSSGRGDEGSLLIMNDNIKKEDQQHQHFTEEEETENEHEEDTTTTTSPRMLIIKEEEEPGSAKAKEGRTAAKHEDGDKMTPYRPEMDDSGPAPVEIMVVKGMKGEKEDERKVEEVVDVMDTIPKKQQQNTTSLLLTVTAAHSPAAASNLSLISSASDAEIINGSSSGHLFDSSSCGNSETRRDSNDSGTISSRSSFLSTADSSKTCSLPIAETSSAASEIIRRGHPMLPTTATTQSYLTSLLQQHQQQQHQHRNSSTTTLIHHQNPLESHSPQITGIDLFSSLKNNNGSGRSSSNLAAAAASAAAQLSRESTITPPAFTSSSDCALIQSGIAPPPAALGSSGASLLFPRDITSAIPQAVSRIPTLQPSLMHPFMMSKLNGVDVLAAAAVAGREGQPPVLPHYGSAAAVAAAQAAAAYQQKVQQLSRLHQHGALKQHPGVSSTHSRGGYGGRRRESAPYTTPTATTQLRQRGSRAQSDDPSVFVACRLCRNKIMASRLSNLTNHVRRHSTMKQFQCCYCDYTHNEMAKVRLHMLHNHKDKDSQPIDNLSPEMQASWDVLMQQCFPDHYHGNKNTGPNGQTHHPDVVRNAAKNLSLTVGRLSCGLSTNGGGAGIITSSSSGGRQGQKNSRISSLVMWCNGCGREVQERDRLEHIHRMHMTCSPYVCSLCGYEDGEQQKVTLHIAMKHHGNNVEIEEARVLTRDTLTIAEALIPKYFRDGAPRSSLPASPSVVGGGGSRSSPVHNPANRLSLPVISSSGILSQPPILNKTGGSQPSLSPSAPAAQSPLLMAAFNKEQEQQAAIDHVNIGESEPKFTCKICSNTIDCGAEGTILIQLLTHAKHHHQQKLRDHSQSPNNPIGTIDSEDFVAEKTEGEWIDWLIPCFPTIAATFLAKKNSDEHQLLQKQQQQEQQQQRQQTAESAGSISSPANSVDGRLSASTSPVSSVTCSSPMETDKEEAVKYSCTICDFVTSDLDQHQMHFWKHTSDQVGRDHEQPVSTSSPVQTHHRHAVNPKIISTI